MYQGDLTEDQTLDFTFTTRQFSTGAPFTLAGTPALSVYKANGTTQSTAGVTLTVDFDTVTGLNHVRIDTSADAFYATANDYSVVITTGTVDGVSVMGETIATFSIENRNGKANVTQWAGSAVATPSVAGVPEVDVTHFAGSAGTFAGGRPEVNASHFAGTAYATALAAEVDAVWDEAYAGHNTGGTFGALVQSISSTLTFVYAGRVLAIGTVTDASATASAFNTDLTDGDDWYNDALIVFTSGNLQNQAPKPIGDFANTNGRFTLDEPFTAAPDNGSSFQVLATHVHPTSQIAAAVLDLDASSYTTNSTLGAIVNDWEDGGRLDLLLDGAASAGDPWTTALPGAYGAGTAGNILGNRLVGTIATGTHNPQSGDAYARLGAPAGASVSADVAAVKSDTSDTLADTNELQTDWANGGRLDLILDARASQTSVDTIDDLLDTEIATIITHLTDIKGATFSSATDSLEAIRDRGDAAWTTATSVTVSDKTGFKLASDGLDSVLVESSISAGASLTNDAGAQLTSINARQALSLTISSLGGVLAGAETTNVTIKPAGLPAGNTRVDATVTADGNRTALTLKVPT